MFEHRNVIKAINYYLQLHYISLHISIYILKFSDIVETV